MEKYVLFIILWVICYSQNLYAQKQGQELIDSLVNCLKDTKEDTNTLKILSTIIDLAPDGVWQPYNNKFGQLSEKLMTSNDRTIKSKGKYFYGVYLNNLAYDCCAKGDYTNGLEYFDKVLKIYKEQNIEASLILNNVGAIYYRLGESDKAMEYHLRALVSIEDNIKQFGLNNIRSEEVKASTLCNIAVIYGYKKDWAKQTEYYKKAEIIIVDYNLSREFVASVYCGLGACLERKGEDSLALLYFEKANNAANKAGDNIGKARSLFEIAKLFYKQGIISQALSKAKESLNISVKSNYLIETISAADLLKDIYQKQENYKQAFEMYNIRTIASDSEKSKENQKAVMRHQFQSDFDLKQAKLQAEQDKKNIQQRNIRNSISASLAGTLIFLVVVYRQRNKVKNEKKNVEKEKARSEELLLNILPAEVAEELKAKGSAEARLIDEVTVIFTDFKGFTQLSEKLSPKALIGEVNECFSAFDHIMQKYGVEKIKTIGDSYMAAGGLPTPNKTHPDDVVQAALEIQQYMQEHKLKKEAEGELFFEIRIGVHTGPVVAGIVGVKKFQYDIWGDTVNTASRMESSCEVGKVNISGVTYELVKDKFKCEYRGEIDAKGKGQLKMYYVG